jgi:hypothetical protein
MSLTGVLKECDTHIHDVFPHALVYDPACLSDVEPFEDPPVVAQGGVGLDALPMILFHPIEKGLDILGLQIPKNGLWVFFNRGTEPAD